MNNLKVVFFVCAYIYSYPSFSQKSEVSIVNDNTTAATSKPTIIGSPKIFTGPVFIDPIFSSQNNREYEMAKVTFLPGSHSNWHSHPGGSTMYITDGLGWTQIEGQPKKILHVGDVVWTPPGVRHWHGATDKNAMTHIVINGLKNNSVVIWNEPVTSQEYLGK